MVSLPDSWVTVLIMKKRKEKKEATQGVKKKGAAKQIRQTAIKRMESATIALEAANYCKRAPAWLHQVKRNLKSERL